MVGEPAITPLHPTEPTIHAGTNAAATLDALREFRYVASGRPLNWHAIRSFDVSFEAPDLDDMKRITCQVLEFAVDSVRLDSSAVHVADLQQLLRTMQAVLQFSVHSQKVMLSTTVHPLRAQVKQLATELDRLTAAAGQREREVASYREQLSQVAKAAEGEKDAVTKSLKLRIDSLEMALSAARTEASAAKAEAAAARMIDPSEEAAAQIGNLRRQVDELRKAVAVERARCEVLGQRLPDGQRPEIVPSWMEGKFMARGMPGEKDAAVELRRVQPDGNTASVAGERPSRGGAEGRASHHRRSCCHRHSRGVPSSAAATAATPFDVASLVTLLQAMHGMVTGGKVQPGIIAPTQQQEQQQQQQQQASVPLAEVPSAAAPLVRATSEAASPLLPGATGNDAHGDADMVHELRRDVRHVMRGMDKLATDIRKLEGANGDLARQFAKQQDALKQAADAAIADALAQLRAAGGGGGGGGTVALSGEVEQRIGGLQDQITRVDRSVKVNRDEVLQRVHDLESALSEKLDALVKNIRKLRDEVKHEIDITRSAAEDARRESSVAVAAAQRRIDTIAEHQQAALLVSKASGASPQPLSSPSMPPPVSPPSLQGFDWRSSNPDPSPKVALVDDAPAQTFGTRPPAGPTSRASSVGVSQASPTPQLGQAFTGSAQGGIPLSARTSDAGGGITGAAALGSRANSKLEFLDKDGDDDDSDADPNACPHCAQIFPDVLEHARACPYRPEVCKYCGQTCSANMKELHLARCTEYRTATAAAELAREKKRPEPLSDPVALQRAANAVASASGVYTQSPSATTDLNSSLAAAKMPPSTPGSARTARIPELSTMRAELERLEQEEAEIERRKSQSQSQSMSQQF
jgi:hypothetical protein